MSKTVRVLVVPTGREPEVREMETSLEAMRALVGGGYIQIVPYLGVDLVCDENGKFNGQPPNRAVWDGADVIFGQFFFCRHDDDGDVASLTDEDIARLREEFR